MARRFHWFGVLFCLWLVPALSAGTVYTFYSGNLRDDATVADCGPGCTLGESDEDGTWAQFAAVVYTFTVSSPSAVYAVTFGWGGGTSGTGAVVPSGGLEPYLSLFDSGGHFLASTYYGTYCPPGANSIGGHCYDVQLDGGTLGPGSYQIALTAFENASYAEYPGGVLADGFTGLGNLWTGENLNYAFDVVLESETPETVPEPGTALPFAAFATALLLARRLHRSLRIRKTSTELSS